MVKTSDLPNMAWYSCATFRLVNKYAKSEVKSLMPSWIWAWVSADMPPKQWTETEKKSESKAGGQS